MFEQLPISPTSHFHVVQERYDAGYGTVLDSGTTFTYLPSEAFVQFRNAVTLFALEHGLHTVKGPDPQVILVPIDDCKYAS